MQMILLAFTKTAVSLIYFNSGTTKLEQWRQ